MACVNMFNNEQHQGLGPRISFSNDFADSQQHTKLENSYREAPVSSDFDFAMPSYTMIAADEIFFKGKLLPLKENCNKVTTLRDELLAGDDDFVDLSPRITKTAGRWRERFGLRRANIVLKKSEKMNESPLERIDEMKRSSDDIFAFKGDKICDV